MKKSIRVILIILFSIILLFSAWKLISTFLNYREGQNSYASLEQYISVDPTEPPSAGTQTVVLEEAGTSTEESQKPEQTPWLSVDFEKLAQINPDIVAWIFIEGTGINYPVVQGTDNDYYLNHLFDGTYHSSGCIFLDAACSANLSNPHTIIYGHNMKDQSMFAELTSYQDQNYYEAHPVVLLVTPTHQYKIRLFSGYVSDPWTNSWQTDFSSQNFGDWVSEIASRSSFSSDVYPSEEDHIVTFSTCSYEFDNARFVVHGYIEDHYTISEHTSEK